MRWQWLERLAWGLGCGAVAFGVIGGTAAPRRGTGVPGAPTALPRPLLTQARTVGSAGEAQNLPGTPFRLRARRPSVRYGEPATSEPAQVQVLPPKPQLQLSGILWGPEPAALVLGMPGEEGEVVLHRGERRGGIRVASIDPDRVRLEGMDTTWTLTIRRPW